MKNATGIPDFQFIRSKIPIAEVARKLGLEVIGNSARCWRHSDQTPSMSLWKKMNTARCFVCDDRAFSNIDLTMKFLGYPDAKEGMIRAIAWITERFEVPNIPKHKHLLRRKPALPMRTGIDLVDDLLMSGVLHEIHYAARFVVLALVKLLKDGPRAISYPGLMRFAGVTSRSQVSEGAHYAEFIGLVEPQRQLGDGLINDVTIYRLTPDSKRFLDYVAQCYRQQREEAALETEQQEARRQARREARRAEQVAARPTAPATAPQPSTPDTAAPHTLVSIRTGLVPMDENAGTDSRPRLCVQGVKPL